jgi:hypothetical protein
MRRLPPHRVGFRAGDCTRDGRPQRAGAGHDVLRTSRPGSRHDLEAVVGAIDNDLGDRHVEL